MHFNTNWGMGGTSSTVPGVELPYKNDKRGFCGLQLEFYYGVGVLQYDATLRPDFDLYFRRETANFL